MDTGAARDQAMNQVPAILGQHSGVLRHRPVRVPNRNGDRLLDNRPDHLAIGVVLPIKPALQPWPGLFQDQNPDQLIPVELFHIPASGNFGCWKMFSAMQFTNLISSQCFNQTGRPVVSF
jgi:hypothetical protein